MAKKQITRREFAKLTGLTGAALPMASLLGCNIWLYTATID
jgi:hypothetical protein